jgi:hypothetical protein
MQDNLRRFQVLSYSSIPIIRSIVTKYMDLALIHKLPQELGFRGVGQPLNLSPPDTLKLFKFSCFGAAHADSNLGRLLAKFPILEVVCVYSGMLSRSFGKTEL